MAKYPVVINDNTGKPYLPNLYHSKPLKHETWHKDVMANGGNGLPYRGSISWCFHIGKLHDWPAAEWLVNKFEYSTEDHKLFFVPRTNMYESDYKNFDMDAMSESLAEVASVMLQSAKADKEYAYQLLFSVYSIECAGYTWFVEFEISYHDVGNYYADFFITSMDNLACDLLGSTLEVIEKMRFLMRVAINQHATVYHNVFTELGLKLSDKYLITQMIMEEDPQPTLWFFSDVYSLSVRDWYREQVIEATMVRIKPEEDLLDD